MAQFDVVIIFQTIWPLAVLLLLAYYMLLNWVTPFFFAKKVCFKKEKFLVKTIKTKTNRVIGRKAKII